MIERIRIRIAEVLRRWADGLDGGGGGGPVIPR
jgi:hypothetical protein